MANPSPDYQQGVRDLIALADSVEPPLLLGGTSATLVAYGLMRHLVYLAEGVQLLSDNGMHFAAASNWRAMLEAAGRLEWLARDGDVAVGVLNREMKRAVERLAEAAKAGFSSITQDNLDAAQRTIDTQLPSSSLDHLKNTKDLLISLGSPAAYMNWLSATQNAHPGLMSARLFFEETDDGVILYKEPRDKAVFPADLFILVELFVGLSQFNNLLPETPWTDQIETLAARYGIPTTPSGGPAPLPEE